MVDYKEILRLTSIGYSLRQTAASVGHSHHTVKNVLELAEKCKTNLEGVEKEIQILHINDIYYTQR